MAQYTIEDSQTGRRLKIEGDSPPTESEMEEIFASYKPASGLGRADAAASRIPGVNQLAEFAGGANRMAMGVIDIIPKAVNEGLNLVGSDARVPTLLGDSFGNKGVMSDRIGQAGDFVGDGLQADILSRAGEFAAAGGLTGSVIRGVNAAIPAGQSAARGSLQTLANTTAAQDVGMGAVAGAGSAIGEEVGGQPGAMIGSIVAPLATAIPAAAAGATRQAFRGSNAAGVQSAIDDAATAGTNLTVGQATGNRTAQAAENISSKLAGGGRLADAAEKSSADIQARMASIADSISTRRGNEAAGRTIKDSITGKDGFIDRFKGQSGALWGDADGAILAKIGGDESLVPIQNTRAVLGQAVRGGALGSILNTPKLAQIKQALDSQISIDYRTLRELRSTIGERISNPELVSDIPRKDLSRLYGAISDDVRAIAEKAGGDAPLLFNRANNHTRAGHRRIDGFIDNVMGKADFSKVFDAVTKGGEGSQTINAFKRSMNPEEWEVVVSNVVRNLGKATPGQQGAEGVEFSVNKFLTDWNKLGPAKRALFSGSRTVDHYGRDLEAIARTAERIKTAQRAGSNPSGTGQFTANTGTGVALATSAATGNYGVTLGILGAIAGNNAGARLMSNPRFVSWLAGTTKTNQELPAQIAKLAAIQRSMPLEDAEAVNGLINQLSEDGGSE